MRSGVAYTVYETSTIAGVTHTMRYSSGSTSLDNAWAAGFWGLTHALDADPPTAITCGVAQQP